MELVIRTNFAMTALLSRHSCLQRVMLSSLLNDGEN